jgi:hypothetical protein
MGDNPGMLRAFHGINQTRLDLTSSQASMEITPGHPLATKDYICAGNPCLGQSKEYCWHQQLQESVMMSKFACITKLVTHIITSCQHHFKGTGPCNSVWQTPSLGNNN